jgi:hypothetical protein
MINLEKVPTPRSAKTATPRHLQAKCFYTTKTLTGRELAGQAASTISKCRAYFNLVRQLYSVCEKRIRIGANLAKLKSARDQAKIEPGNAIFVEKCHGVAV